MNQTNEEISEAELFFSRYLKNYEDWESFSYLWRKPILRQMKDICKSVNKLKRGVFRYEFNDGSAICFWRGDAYVGVHSKYLPKQSIWHFRRPEDYKAHKEGCKVGYKW